MNKRIARKVLKLGRRIYSVKEPFKMRYTDAQYDIAFKKLRKTLDIPTGAW